MLKMTKEMFREAAERIMAAESVAEPAAEPQLQRPNAVIRNGGPILLRGLMLPLSPSMNTYWRTRVIVSKKRGGRAFASTYVSEDGVKYQERIKELALIKKFMFNTEKRLRIDMVVCMPTRREADIDNRIKPFLDALAVAGVYVNDEQVDVLLVRRGPIMKGGRIVVSIVEIQPDYDAVFREAWG